jgi:hypothetical protein
MARREFITNAIEHCRGNTRHYCVAENYESIDTGAAERRHVAFASRHDAPGVILIEIDRWNQRLMLVFHR